MTEQKAMGYLQTLANRIPLKFYTDKGVQIYDDFSQVVFKALEKQIPKKWEYEQVCDDDTYICPCCKEYWYLEGMNPTQSEYNYCPNCGQALKWE